jgi:putative transposase
MPTIVVPGVALHVTQLRAARQPLFVDSQDYAAFLLDLGEGAAVFGCAVHAYVLMSDRLHLLLTPTEPDGPSRLMQVLGRRHERCWTRRHTPTEQFCAPLVRATPVYSDHGFLACSCRIELSPVRAKIVSEPVAYRWSSYRCNGLGARDAVLTRHPTYLALGPNSADRQRAYRALFCTKPAPGWRSIVAGGVMNGPPGSRAAEVASGR